jgi:hypothetical protein
MKKPAQLLARDFFALHRPTNSALNFVGRAGHILTVRPVQSKPVKASQTESNQIQPPYPLPVKKSVKKRPALRSLCSKTLLGKEDAFDEGESSFWLFLTTASCAIRPNPTNFYAADTHHQPATYNLQPSTPAPMVSFSLADCLFQPRQRLQNPGKYPPAHYDTSKP